MDAQITLTSDMMKQARDYIPLEEKETWVAINAPKCFDKLAITADDDPMPPMYMVNTGLKSRYLMGALARLYFGIEELPQSPAVTTPPKAEEPENEDKWLMSVEEYDAWAGSHVFNQLERWKRDADLKCKAYDIVFDYKDLEKRFSAQISSLLTVQNDPVIRQAQQSAAMVKELPAVLEMVKAYQEGKENGKQPAE